ncbi:disintegrin and metalloproteinase domain-containing protein 33 isoform X5 [Diachasmimorpha longicaudata]|uniref:disintegrin and metalloproteinase domain-containing protein 33 isoform X5 n=1 Tax=Diachasmimorpha longicaudata TaxID=58733 RepID=UPI0030B896DF
MFWVHCGLFVLVIAVPGFISTTDSTSKREADYTLDDSFWNEETPAGEVERLLREYRQNQELVRDIGAHNYQIIYPVQLRHHEKMGISTREAGFPKYPQRSGYSDSYQNARGRSRAGKHFHRTSLLIKAFNHKFRLDLELNTQLLAPNLMQKDFLSHDAEQVSKQEIEHCYYHGTVRDYPGASAAFHTCNGVSGVIHLGNETFVIQPFYGGDLSQRHPHVIFEARTKANKGCGIASNIERRLTKNRRQKHVLGLSETIGDRYKRDVREATKYIETAMVIDKAMFDKRNGSSRAEVVHDAIQVANIADLYFRTLNTRVSVVYIETWSGGNQAQIESGMEINRAIQNFNDYIVRKMYKSTQDTIQMLTGETFQGGESGVAAHATVCSPKSVGISVDLNTYEPHLLAGTMAHMIGHNIGMQHDDGRENCYCRDWHGCIMAQSIVGADNVQPYKFSECSKADYEEALKAAHGICLFNKPNELETRLCGNRVIDADEECDCGTLDDCPDIDPCCDPITCKLKAEAECASGPCCNECKLLPRGSICRESSNECDLPEVCTGESGQCPVDLYKKNGKPCANNESFCFSGFCPDLNVQCTQVWGDQGKAGDMQCFEQFNSKGSINGHCGTDSAGHFVKCESGNVRCGSLQCQDGSEQPVIDGMDPSWSRTIISIRGKEYECKATSGKVEGKDLPGMGLVHDGTSCGDNLICVNQTCTNVFPYIDQGKCPSNQHDLECSGNGVCTNVNKCHCEPGWSGPDCSIQSYIPTPKPTTTSTEAPAGKPTESANKHQKKETPYENYHGSNTVFLVGMLMSVVGGVFVVFALMALCYRSVVVHKNFSLCLRRKSTTIQKCDPPYQRNPKPKTYTTIPANHPPESAALDGNKILAFDSMAPYSSDAQRVLFQSQNNVGTPDGPRLKDHKSQPKRLGMEDEDGGTGAEDVVSFIDLPPNSLTKLPEKGILKKHGLEDGRMVEMQRTLNSLNGYHGELMQALRTAARHHGMSRVPSGSGNIMDDETLTKSLAECKYPDSYRKVSIDNGQDNIDNQDDDDEDDVPPTCGPIRIRTLEDIIRQLEVHSARHNSPSGSEDMRISEGEGERHYRMDSSVCSESSQGSRRCSRVRDDDPRLVYGRYRQPASRSPYGTHQHTHQHSHQMHEEEGIYETADPDRGSNTRGETPDSESDAFIQAQQPLARWTSEERIERRPPQQPPPISSSMALPSTAVTTDKNQELINHQQLPDDKLPLNKCGYYPFSFTTDNGHDNDTKIIKNAQSQQQLKLICPELRGIDVNHTPNNKKCPLDDNNSLDCNINNGNPNELNTNNTSDNENTALLTPTHFPEYKH